MDPIEQLGQEYDEIEALGNSFDQQRNSNNSRGLEEQKLGLIERLMRSAERYGDEQSRGHHAQNAFTLGGAQQIGEMGANALNALPGVNISKPNLRGLVQEEDFNPLFTAGEIGYGIPAAAGAYGAARALPLLGGGAVLPRMGAGALAGGLTGGDTPQERTIGAGLGAAGGLGTAATRLTNRSVGNQIVHDANQLQHAFHNEFRDIFQDAANSGIRNITRRSITTERMRDYSAIVTRKEQKKIRDFMEHNSFENAHEAQSDIGAAIRRMQNMPRTQALTDAINAAEEMQRGILNAIENQFEHQGARHIAQRYMNARGQYAERMAPYLNNKNIVNARKEPTNKEFMEAFRLPHELSKKGNDSFMRLMLEQYPELRLNRTLAGPVGKAALGVAGVGGAGGLVNYALKER